MLPGSQGNPEASWNDELLWRRLDTGMVEQDFTAGQRPEPLYPAKSS